MGRGHGSVAMSKDHLRFADVDGIDKGLVCIDEIHFNIHRGIFFTVSHYDGTIANEGFLTLFMEVTSPIHARFTAAFSGDFTGSLFSGSSMTPDTGVVKTSWNRNGFSSKVSNAVFTVDPTVTEQGTAQVVQFLPGGSGGNAIGATVSSFEEWILPAGSYMLRMANVSGQSRKGSITVEFYQPNLA